MTQDKLNIERKVCQQKLKELQQQAHYLCMCRLQQRYRATPAKGDVDKAKVLLELINKERKNKRWRRIHRVAAKRHRWSVLSVKVPIVDAEGNNASGECTTHQNLFDAARPVLTGVQLRAHTCNHCILSDFF